LILNRYLEVEGIEKTFNITQKQLKDNVDEDSAKKVCLLLKVWLMGLISFIMLSFDFTKVFDLKLTTFGPYSLDYTRNGRYI